MDSVKTLVLHSSLGRFAAAGAAALLLIGCVSREDTILPEATSAVATVSAPQLADTNLQPTPVPSAAATSTPVPPTPVSFLGPIAYKLPDLRTGPIDIPLELKIPSLGINAPILGVGITPENIIKAKMAIKPQKAMIAIRKGVMLLFQ